MDGWQSESIQRTQKTQKKKQRTMMDDGCEMGAESRMWSRSEKSKTKTCLVFHLYMFCFFAFSSSLVWYEVHDVDSTALRRGAEGRIVVVLSLLIVYTLLRHLRFDF